MPAYLFYAIIRVICDLNFFAVACRSVYCSLTRAFVKWQLLIEKELDSEIVAEVWSGCFLEADYRLAGFVVIDELWHNYVMHLRMIRFNGVSGAETAVFPFNIPAISKFEQLEITAPVTFLVGENGSGKSTFIEALALAVGANTIGSEDVGQDETLTAVRQLANQLRLVWRARTRNGFFLRAEDFFGYVKRLGLMEAELLAELKQVDEDYVNRSEAAKGFAKLPYENELQALRKQYGRYLHTYSHGESFLELFQARFQPNSLYLLDEPEMPLSPMRQLTLISLMKQMVAQNCQFIIATHSPILMAFPDAVILSFDEIPIQPVNYEALEHVTVTRSFLNDPEAFLRHL